MKGWGISSRWVKMQRETWMSPRKTHSQLIDKSLVLLSFHLAGLTVFICQVKPCTPVPLLGRNERALQVLQIEVFNQLKIVGHLVAWASFTISVTILHKPKRFQNVHNICCISFSRSSRNASKIFFWGFFLRIFFWGFFLRIFEEDFFWGFLRRIFSEDF